MNKRNTVAVSVIIPCYRCAGTIMRAVSSVATQTCLPAEVILVDDASNDQTIDVLKSMQSQYGEWLRVVQLPTNLGAASARNAAWNVASQPYIALLDADDAWHPQKLEIQYKFMLDNPNVILCGHNAKIVEGSFNPDWLTGKFKFNYISKWRLLTSNPFVTPSVMIRKDIELRFNPKKRYVDDHLLWLQILFNGYKVAKLSPALVAIYKPMFGASGLSSNMWAMEKSELNNYWILFENKSIGLVIVVFLSFYSLSKYLRRLIIVSIRQMGFVSK